MRSLVPGLFAALLITLGACASRPDITTDYDHSTNFSNYRSFAFEPKLGGETAGYTSLTTQRIKAATQREMTARGYVYDEANPDLLVNFSAKLEDKVSVTQTPVPMSYYYGYYGYRAGLYAPWPGYTFDTNVNRYTEGTINIDLIDRQRRQMVWEGVASAASARARRRSRRRASTRRSPTFSRSIPSDPAAQPRNKQPSGQTGRSPGTRDRLMRDGIEVR